MLFPFLYFLFLILCGHCTAPHAYIQSKQLFYYASYRQPQKYRLSYKFTLHFGFKIIFPDSSISHFLNLLYYLLLNTDMKQLTTSMPLCYLLPNSELITALPYIDEQAPEQKNKIQYLIKSEQQSMQYNQSVYLQDLVLPNTTYLNSEQFQQEVNRIKAKIEQKKGQTKQKSTSVYDELNPNIVTKKGKLTEQNRLKIEKAAVTYQNNIIKEINLQLYQKLAPLVQKQYISALDKRKELLVAAIEKQKQLIEQINKNRQYQQLQAKEREQTVRDRLQVMIHKKIKLEQ